MMIVQRSLELLGSRMRDVFTGVSGVVSSVSFDAAGCVQAYLSRPADKDGKLQDSHWFDIKRLAPDGERALDAPRFELVAAGTEPGGQDLPQPPRP